MGLKGANKQAIESGYTSIIRLTIFLGRSDESAFELVLSKQQQLPNWAILGLDCPILIANLGI